MTNSLDITDDFVQVEVCKEIISNDFYYNMNGKMDQVLIQLAKNIILDKIAPHSAELSFEVNFEINVDNGKTFYTTDFAGFASGGVSFGDIYTDDLNRLYRDTVSFEFTNTTIYLSIVFLDRNSSNLGTFQCGSFSPVTGVGTGFGTWY